MAAATGASLRELSLPLLGPRFVAGRMQVVDVSSEWSRDVAGRRYTPGAAPSQRVEEQPLRAGEDGELGELATDPLDAGRVAVAVLGPGVDRLQTVELGVSKAALALPRLANER